jgi:hypothetical protein
LRRFVTAVAGVWFGLVCTGCSTQVGIAASPSEIYVEVGGSAVVRVVAVMDSGSPVPVTTPLTITSSDEEVAQVSDETVVGVAEGTAVLSISDGVFDTSATVQVVAAGTLPDELVVTPVSISCTAASEDTQLEVFAILSTGAGEDVTDQASFSSSDTSAALVTSAGLVVCVDAGQAIITTKYLGFSVVVDVQVGAVPPRAVAFASTILDCTAGESQVVQVSATWENGTTTDVSESASYSSSDPSVATALAGQVECLAEGTARIVADVAGVTDTLFVTVEPVQPDPDELVDLRFVPSSITCNLAGSVYFALIAEYGDGRTEDVTTNSQTRIQSTSTAAILVPGGQVLCVQQGQATLQAAFGGAAASATVTIE